jgi:hypothetical protein
MNKDMALPDSMKDYKKVTAFLKRVMAEPNTVLMGAYNDDGEIGAVFGVINAEVGDEGRFIMWMWDKKVMTCGLVKAIRNYLDYIVKNLELYRVTAQTPCKKMCRFLEIVGLKCEGRFKRAFRYNGRHFTLYQYRALGG